MRRVLLLLVILLLFGCSNDQYKSQKKTYYGFINDLKTATIKDFKDDIPFSISLYYDKLIETEVMYRVIIDKPKEPIRNIEAIAIHNKQTEDMFPTSGIFDEKYSLIPNVVNKKSGYVKGIILIGYIPFDEDISKFNAEFRVLVKYQDDDLKTHKVYFLSKVDNKVPTSD